MTTANENDALDEAGRWYVDVLGVVGDALEGCGYPRSLAPNIVRVLAQRGWTIERDPAPVLGED